MLLAAHVSDGSGASNWCPFGNISALPPRADIAADIVEPPVSANSGHRCRSLLRACRERPCSRRTAEQRDELAAFHSITSSARASNVGGTSSPIDLAVLRLTTSSYFVGNCTGNSNGLVPFRIRSTYDGACWNRLMGLAP